MNNSGRGTASWVDSADMRPFFSHSNGTHRAAVRFKVSQLINKLLIKEGFTLGTYSCFDSKVFNHDAVCLFFFTSSKRPSSFEPASLSDRGID